MWNRIGRTVASSRGLTLWENARLFALLNLGLADGYIASFGDKYFYNYWRPVTAIREGNNDGNPDTAGDPQWTPLVVTPPLPDYDSGHAVEGGTAAGILQGFFHNDRISFAVCSTTLPPGETCFQVRTLELARSIAFLKLRQRTECHASWLAFTSGMPSKRASFTGKRSRTG